MNQTRLIIYVLLSLGIISQSCSSRSSKEEKCPISKEQYNKDKNQIANYVLNNIEYYRLNPGLRHCDFPDVAGYFVHYSIAEYEASGNNIIAPVSVSKYLCVYVDTIIYDSFGQRCFIFCAIGNNLRSIIKSNTSNDKKFDAKAFVGVRKNNIDSLTLYPFVKFQTLGYRNMKEAVQDLEYYYFHQLKGDGLSASYYEKNGFKQNVIDPDFFEKSVIFQRCDDSTYNYQYCYKEMIKYPYMR